MKVNEFYRIDEREFKHILILVKQWIGIRGIKLLLRYLNTASDSNKDLILSKTSILLCRYSAVMTCRLIMLDIQHQYFMDQELEIQSWFKITTSEFNYIQRQMKRFISNNVKKNFKAR